MDKVFSELGTVQAMHGWTDAQLATKLGITPSSLSRYKAGLRQPSLDLIRGIARLIPQTTDSNGLYVAIWSYLMG